MASFLLVLDLTFWCAVACIAIDTAARAHRRASTKGAPMPEYPTLIDGPTMLAILTAVALVTVLISLAVGRHA